jgi:hypothetical protein
MQFDANGNILEGDDGGIYRLLHPNTPSTRAWQAVIGNLEDTELYQLAYDDVNHTILGSSQDNGSPQQTGAGSLTYQDVSGGDGGDAAIDNTSTPGFSIHYSSRLNLFGFQRQTYNNANTVVSTAAVALRGLQPVDRGPPGTARPYALNAVDPRRMLIGGVQNIYESTDQGDDLTIVGALPAGPGGRASAVAYGGMQAGVANPFVAYVGTVGGALLLRTTSGGPFTRLTAYTGGVVLAIVLDPDNWQRAYVVGTNGPGAASQVFLTTNAGASFTNITGNLGALTSQVFTLDVVDPTPGSVSGDEAVVVGGLGGVFVTTHPSAGAVWSLLAPGLPDAVASDIHYDATDNVLVAATFGRGAWLLPNVRGTIFSAPPAFTDGPPPSSATLGTPYNFTYTASGSPAPTFSVTSGALPTGLTLSAAGVISGTPNATGTFTGTVTASNGVSPNATQNFSITVNQATHAPAFTSGNATTFTVGSAGTFTVTTTGSPTPTITESGALPSGVTFVNNHNGTATLSGTPASGTAGTYHLTFTASNGVKPNASQTFTLTVNQATNQAPAFTSANNTTFTVGSPGSFTVTTTGNPTATITLAGKLPGGVTFVDNHNGTATLSGTPNAGTANTYTLTFTAANGVAPNATQTFTLTVRQPPSASAALDAAGAALVDSATAADVLDPNVLLGARHRSEKSGAPA